MIWPALDDRLTWCHSNGLSYVTLSRPGRVRVEFVTRRGGASPPPYSGLNLARIEDDTAVSENRRRLCSVLDIHEDRIAWAPQVHGTAAIVARAGGRAGASGDILLTDRPGLMLMGLFADCVPIALVDTGQRAVALVHAGWRGTAAGACAVAVSAMWSWFGIKSNCLTAVIGPAIGPCCYRVGPEVLTAVCGGEWDRPDDLDLVQANVRQLVMAGVDREQIVGTGICTSCRNDLFFSHRRSGGQTGRFAVVVGLEPIS